MAMYKYENLHTGEEKVYEGKHPRLTHSPRWKESRVRVKRATDDVPDVETFDAGDDSGDADSQE